ncbi:MAG: hypothetical protein R3F15_07515 [Lysobacterales bacterium]
MISLLLAGTANAATLWESEDTLYNLNFLGFFHLNGAARFGDDDERDPAIVTGFQEARLIGHFSSRLGSRFSAFMEVEATHTDDDTRGRMERLILKYDINNASQFSVGRFHAPVGYWNQYYHHGRWLQVSKDRPLQTEFGGAFLPAHYWGAMYERNIPMGERIIELDLGAGAGRDEDVAAPSFDEVAVAKRLSLAKHGGHAEGTEVLESNWSVMGQVNVVPASRRGLAWGGSFWYADLDGDGLKVKERIVTMHLNYIGESSALLGEIAHSQHERPSGGGHTDSTAGYLEYNFLLDSVSPRLRPYGRVEMSDIDDEDVAYSSVNSRSRLSLGARFDVTPSSALKFEVRRDRLRDGGPSTNTLQAQYAVIFW